ncbi:efflux RND transporter periplasmic adaptor subunit [Aliagarivorans taiwanensis]|uniref:efflux RND transporter periplasmic adaptor subunit n=1 Tax=Aliagarivorans taiwanensis TaxID=561966 RepID=UPI000429859A|nr:efflux RND transporter periplasmic adaptor subunit [Aliagarivorans taiwanensis]
MRKWQQASIAMAVLSIVGCERGGLPEGLPTLQVSTVEVGAVESSQYRQFNGVTEAAELTPLAFRLEGEISRILVRAGDIVEKGQLLAELDNRTLSQQLADSKAQFELASRQLSRAQGLVEQKLLSPAEFDELKANKSLTEVNYKLAQAQLEYSKLYAPFSGEIAEVPKEAFESTSPGETVLSLYQHQQVHVRLQLPNSVMAQIDPDAPEVSYQPSATFGNLQQSFPVSYYKHSAEPAQASQSFELWLAMPQISPPVLPGTEVQVLVDMAAAGLSSEVGYLAPLTALQPGNAPGEFYAWKVVNGQAQQVQVEVGEVVSHGALVTQGLTEGDQLITSSLSRLRSDMAVVVEQQEQAQ